MSHSLQKAVILLFSLLLLGAGGAGCSIRKLAMNRVADALSSGSGTFASDNDPELVGDALPFSLKLMESILAETPRHEGLLTALGGGFTQYAYAFVQQQAERVEDEDLDRARELQLRARNLYLRGRDYALRGLEVRHAGLGAALAADPGAAVARTTPADVPLLYWCAASWAGAIAQAKDDPVLVGDLPKVEALVDRALVLDEGWNRGALHGLMITYEMSRVTGEGDPVERATRHFRRAVELGGGRMASPYVAYAESVCVPREDRAGFEENLARALAVAVDAAPEWRLENLILQRRARWLLGRADRLFLPAIP